MRRLKGVALAALAGTILQFGSCLSLDNPWTRALWDGTIYAGWEFVGDNDAVFDLFEDGDVADAG